MRAAVLLCAGVLLFAAALLCAAVLLLYVGVLLCAAVLLFAAARWVWAGRQGVGGGLRQMQGRWFDGPGTCWLAPACE